ncbi:histidine kinase [Ramlibacter sp. RBP-2]|uniref:Histidine kinase n=1 Tax=Ramlibacter lithotrophicus TaxID=2606681 RepID=A0A7X6I7K9_9BURK|nr:cache domain-containing protein [Ramlibacter lithotrophicus]NKE67508.1 histidine kinase [Ramlibacter lithotrophicus]
MRTVNAIRNVLALVAMLAVAAFALQAQAQDPSRGSPAEAQAMVKKALEFYQKNGREKALAEFMKKPGPFVERDLYVTVYTLQGDSLAHINPKMVGKNMMDLRDPDGKFLIKERMDAAARGSSGWQDYKFFNPVSKKIEPKQMYWEKHDNLVFAAGAYKPL